MIQTKNRQIQSYQNDLVIILDKKSNLNKRLADKRNKHSNATLKLQKEEENESKKLEKVHNDTLKRYEARINSLTIQLSQSQGLALNGDPQTLYSNINNEEYDVFVSHASEDKESFVNEFCENLMELDIKVWYDSMSIKWGDSLRSKIDDGLRNSKFGIVVISPAFINKGWTQYELDGLFQLEMTGGKTILPIWHNIAKKEVQDFSPSLAAKKALTTALLTPEEIANELKEILFVETQ